MKSRKLTTVVTWQLRLKSSTLWSIVLLELGVQPIEVLVICWLYIQYVTKAKNMFGQHITIFRMMATYETFWHKKILSIIKLTINANNQNDAKYNQERTPLLIYKGESILMAQSLKYLNIMFYWQVCGMHATSLDFKYVGIVIVPLRWN